MKEVETIITCEIAAAERARISRMIGETHNNRYVSPPKVRVFVREV